MVCEMFVLGNRDLRLPGLGSYLQTASNAGDVQAIACGLVAMIAVIVLIDQAVWRPVIAWSERFKFEQVEASETPSSPVLDFLCRSRILSRLGRLLVAPAREALTLHFARASANDRERSKPASVRWLVNALLLTVTAGVIYAAVAMGAQFLRVSPGEFREILWGAGAPFLRVELTLVLAALWTIPVGVFIGLKPRLSAMAQPIAQIAASVPAPALFSIVSAEG